MSRLCHLQRATLIAILVLAVSTCGCTSLSDYIHNGFKVGPNYCPPSAPVASHWIDANDIHVASDQTTICHWWTVFNDPKLNELVWCAYRQNLTLREAGFRILQARANLSIAIGEIFPQQQFARGAYARNAAAVGARSSSGFGIERFSDAWNLGFSLNWELDFWGRFRRAIAAADANLDASIFDYDFVLVTLLGDVATNYVTIRTTDERIRLLQENVKLQGEVAEYIRKRMEGGKLTPLDYDQAVSNLRQSEAGIPLLEIAKRQAEDSLCILLGMPAVDLSNMLGTGPIPTAPPELAIGIPADLLRRRPDVRRAERLAAAQAEQIGIAQAALYPAFTINGSLGYAAQDFRDLFRETAFNGSVGPSFQWNILNYGRITNNVRYQDAKFQELVVAFQQAAIQADQEVEDGLVLFLRSQRRSRLLGESASRAQEAVQIARIQYENAIAIQPTTGDFNRFATIEQSKVTQDDSWAQARGQIAQGLINVYRALGGGWELKFAGDQGPAGPQPPMPGAAEEAGPSPMPAPPAVPDAPRPPVGPAL
jgi:NodT family efflux transporter outer membrane factor (OMF) lipoprotein